VAIVLSMTSGTPTSWATAAIGSMSRTSCLGLEMASPKKAIVFGRAAARHCSGSSGFATNVVSMPSFGRVWWNRL